MMVRPPRLPIAIAVALTASACGATPAAMKATDANAPLRLERVIELPNVTGRIDHLALDVEHRRLFVAEYGNGSVDEIDLSSGKVVGRIAGLREPQGVAYLPDTREIVVASGDGSVRFYASADRREVARITLGKDADNVRVDSRNGHVIVGYGSGALATIDPATHRVLARLALSGHPEGFRLIGSRVFVNIPDKSAIVAADLDRNRVTATWPTGLDRLNFPMAVGPAAGWIAIAYRLPSTLQFIAIDNGRVIEAHPICGDADDLFISHKRIMVVCGAGHVDVAPLANQPGATTRVTTAPGARTGLFSAELERLFVAVPARSHPAAIWIMTERTSSNQGK